tara:strand:+ start:409 stop:903 length:495 start_codon:yes stop_codon:yes gene_type:complete
MACELDPKFKRSLACAVSNLSVTTLVMLSFRYPALVGFSVILNILSLLTYCLITVTEGIEGDAREVVFSSCKIVMYCASVGTGQDAIFLPFVILDGLDFHVHVNYLFEINERVFLFLSTSGILISQYVLFQYSKFLFAGSLLKEFTLLYTCQNVLKLADLIFSI